MPSEPDDIRVLVLGSDPALTLDGATSLETDAQFEVTRTETASEASRALDRRAFDCIVVDDTAPGVDGAGFVATYCRNESDLSVLLVAEPDDEAVVEEALSAGADEFFRKTVGSDGFLGLANRVHALVERQRSNRREAEYREKASQLDTIFEDLPVSLYFKDEQARHVRVSKGHATGYEGYYPPRGKGDLTIESPGDFLGETDRDLFPEDNARESYEDDRRVIETGDPLPRKVEHLEFGDGGERWLTTTKVPWRGPDGDVKGLLGFSLDITERKRYERELERQNERLEAFAEVLSHDLRNPLNVASGRLDLVRDEHDGEHYEAIERSLDRMAELVDDLLALARHGQRVDDIERVDLPGCLDRSWQSVATGEATLSVETDAAVRADPGRLRQLFENLFRNAVEHGPPNSGHAASVHERAAEGLTVTVGDLDGGFYVADDGNGIPEADCERLFERDFTTAESGTGFGLAIVREIAEAHGWEVEATEGPSGGARFELTGVELADGQ